MVQAPELAAPIIEIHQDAEVPLPRSRRLRIRLIFISLVAAVVLGIWIGIFVKHGVANLVQPF